MRQAMIRKERGRRHPLSVCAIGQMISRLGVTNSVNLDEGVRSCLVHSEDDVAGWQK